MAEAMAAEVIKVVFQKLGDEVMKQIARARGIQSEIKNLGKTLSDIQDLLNDAADKETADENVKQWLNRLQHLAYDIDDLLDGLATDAMHRELTNQSGATTSKVRKFIPTCCTNFKLSSKLQHKLDSIASKLQMLEKEKVSLGLNNIEKDEKPISISSRKNETSLLDSSEIIGREEEKKELLHKLLGDEPCNKNFSVVPIVGMGGVGKTTLARILYNETDVKKYFNLRVWVCVSDDFDIFKISETILRAMPSENKELNENKKLENLNELQIDLSEKLKKELNENKKLENLNELQIDLSEKLKKELNENNKLENLNELQIDLSEKLKKELNENNKLENLNELQIDLSEKLKEKRFLLVLDDIWSEKYAEWENLVKPLHSGAPGSKIIITTRKEGLLKQIGLGHLDKLETLSHDDAMSLLARHALDVGNFDPHPTLKPYADGIVKNCGRLPLALKVVGRLLNTKTNEQYWQSVLNNKIWKTNDNIVPALRLSYQELSACLKQLFAYCSFFPKDFLFDKKELVLLWVAEGFIKQSLGSLSTEESLGHEYFEELLSRSFFQHAPNDDSFFVMHGLLNDLATFVSGDFFLRLNDQLETKTEVLAKYRHMSFIREEYVGYHKFEAFKRAKSLRTFFAMSVGVKESLDCFYLSNKILVELLPELPLLRVLSLSGFEISEVPECIGRLKHLRYLNLSQTKIKELPENVGNLYNLQSLIVFDCAKLCKLPKSFSKLKNLRHLDIRNTPLLKQMPLGIGELSSLQTLSKIIIEGDDRFTIDGLKELKNLEGKICIEGLDKVKDARHARDASLSTKRLTEVELVWDDVNSRKVALANNIVSVAHTPDDALTLLFELLIQNRVLEDEILSELNPCNDALTILKIVSYQGTKFPDWVGDPSFHKLVEVSIVDCLNCTSLPVLGRLQSLKKLEIIRVKVNEIGSELLGTGGVAFPSLELLSFVDMPEWRVWSTCNGAVDAVLPRLNALYIVGCPNLINISLEALPSLRYLGMYACGDGVLSSLIGVASSLTELEIGNIAGLNDEVWRGVIQNLKAIKDLKVHDCNEIRYMWESEEEASKVLMNLRRLEVKGCSKLVRLGEKEEDCRSNLLIRNLRLKDCENVKDCNCPGSIETLEIIKCSSITSISFLTRDRGMQKLKSLTIDDCKELVVVMGKELLDGGENTSNTQVTLELANIKSCPNLKSMNGLLNSTHLTSLTIWDCENMESFPDLELPNLTSLTNLIIAYYPSLDGSFTRGHWPPKLTKLVIGRLKKPISEWGPQNFPTSLVELVLIGGEKDYGMKDFDRLSIHHFFPSNLTTLKIWGFVLLRTVSAGLKHLTSLQHLQIGGCPFLSDLPKEVLPSLLSIKIDGCPTLTSQRGLFNKISHIPSIEIDIEMDEELQN